jgi:hypothetical protein
MEASASPAESAGYPKAWLWDEDGEVADGAFVRIDEAPTKQGGLSPIVILLIAGIERTVWLFYFSLVGGFREELERRDSHELEPGERVVIARQNGGKKKKSEAGRDYVDFKVRFPDRPTRSAASILGASESRSEPEESKPAPEESSQEEEPSGSSSDDDVPF